MAKYTNPFDAMAAANGLLVKKGLCIHDGDWSRGILSYTCSRLYVPDGIHYTVEMHLTQECFEAATKALGIIGHEFGVYRMDNDPYVRIRVTIESVLTLLVLVPEDEVDAIMAL